MKSNQSKTKTRTKAGRTASLRCDALVRPLIVCAAMKMNDGLIVTGVRHYSPEMRSTLWRIYGAGYHRWVVDQGFIDTQGNFLTREAAWKVAETNNQIRKQVSVPGTLFSENLY